jgi:uncharacterized membrane protein
MDSNRTAPSNSPNLQPEAVTPPVARGRRSIRERLLGGLMLAMPLLLTLYILGLLYSFLEKQMIDPLAGLLLWKLKWTTSSETLPYWFETWVAPVIAIVTVLVLLYTLDLLAKTRFHRGMDWTLRRLPIFSQVYAPIQQVFQSLEQGSAEKTPQRMVLITFPHPGVKLPAFVTGSCRDVDTQKLVLCVYVPTTPVPTTGFFLLVPEEEVTELNWNTEQALQAVVSGGLACPREVSYFSLKKESGNPKKVLISSDPPTPGQST